MNQFSYLYPKTLEVRPNIADPEAAHFYPTGEKWMCYYGKQSFQVVEQGQLYMIRIKREGIICIPVYSDSTNEIIDFDVNTDQIEDALES